jgi:hypothetical protein
MVSAGIDKGREGRNGSSSPGARSNPQVRALCRLEVKVGRWWYSVVGELDGRLTYTDKQGQTRMAPEGAQTRGAEASMLTLACQPPGVDLFGKQPSALAGNSVLWPNTHRLVYRSTHCGVYQPPGRGPSEPAIATPAPERCIP